MNSLSIIIYVISLIDSILHPLWVLLGWSIFFLFITSFGMFVSNIVLRTFAADDDRFSELWMNNGYPYLRKMFRWSLGVFIVLTMVTVIIPDKKYAIMIAASEIGERFMKTDEAQKIATDVTGLSGDATELLRQYIKQQTEQIKQEMVDQTKAIADQSKKQ